MEGQLAQQVPEVLPQEQQAGRLRPEVKAGGRQAGEGRSLSGRAGGFISSQKCSLGHISQCPHLSRSEGPGVRNELGTSRGPPVLPACTTWADAGSMPGQKSTSQTRGQAGEKVGSCLQDALSHGSERPQAPAFLTSKTLVLFESPQPAAGAARRRPGAPWRSGHRPVTHQLVLAWLGRKQTRGGRQCGSPTCRMGGGGDRVRFLRRLWDKTCDPTTFLWVESEMLVPGTYGVWPDTYGREALRNTPGCHKGSTPVSLWWAPARAQWMEPTRPGRFSPRLCLQEVESLLA